MLSGCSPRRRLRSRRTLKNGLKGDDVFRLQECLSHLGYMVDPPDGYYGILTEEAVQELQRDYGLPPDGIAGNRTLALFSSAQLFSNRVIHTVQSGESLGTISRLYGVDVRNIMRSNKLVDPDSIYEGQKLSIVKRAVTGVLSKSMDSNEVKMLSSIEPDPLRVIQSCQLSADAFSVSSIDAIATLLNMDLEVLPRISVGGRQSAQIAWLEKDSRRRLGEVCVQLLRSIPVAGLCFDLRVLDRGIWYGFRDFVRDMRAELGTQKQIGVLVPTEVLSCQSHGLVSVVSYLGSLVDWIAIGSPLDDHAMSEPSPQSAYSQVSMALDTAVSLVPRYKILLTLYTDGIHWTEGRTNSVRYVGVEEAEKLAYRYGAKIRWDDIERAYTFTYSSRRSKHTIWYEGERGLSARCRLVNRYNILGVLVCCIDRAQKAFWDTVNCHFILSNKN